MSIVYILTNKCMPNDVKIGRTDNLKQRIKSFNKTNVSESFECYYAVEVTAKAALAIEKAMHQGLDDYRTNKKREFFEITPEKAKSLLSIAEVMGGKPVTPTTDIVKTPQDQDASNRRKATRKRKAPKKDFNFGMIGLDEGTVLQFKKNRNITCTVANDTQVNFRGERMPLSRSAGIVLKEMGRDWKSVQGPAYWCHNGKTLNDLRLAVE